jgi:hypothetical protein
MFARKHAFSATKDLGVTDAFVKATIKHAVERFKINRAASPADAEKIMQILDSGALDADIERNLPSRAKKLEPRNFADARPYSDEEWLKRHGDGI